MDLRLYSLREDDFDGIIQLGSLVHGENYLNQSGCEEILRKSCFKSWNCSYVMYDGPRRQLAQGGKLIGFRLTYAPGLWEIDERCSPEEWGVPAEEVCYFKSNTLNADYRGQGIGSVLLNISIEAVKKMGAKAGIAHIWLQSPGKSAFRYFTRNGGQLVAIWPERWKEESIEGQYNCAHCGDICCCDAAEMILHFGEQGNE